MNPISVSEIVLLIIRLVLASGLENRYLTIAYLFCLSVIIYLITYIQNYT